MRLTALGNLVVWLICAVLVFAALNGVYHKGYTDAVDRHPLISKCDR